MDGTCNGKAYFVDRTSYIPTRPSSVPYANWPSLTGCHDNCNQQNKLHELITRSGELSGLFKPLFSIAFFYTRKSFSKRNIPQFPLILGVVHFRGWSPLNEPCPFYMHHVHLGGGLGHPGRPIVANSLPLTGTCFPIQDIEVLKSVKLLLHFFQANRVV